jgi:hypothetical protein
MESNYDLVKREILFRFLRRVIYLFVRKVFRLNTGKYDFIQWFRCVNNIT